MPVTYNINAGLILKIENAMKESIEEIRDVAGNKLFDTSQIEVPVDTEDTKKSGKLEFPAKNKATVTYGTTHKRTGKPYVIFVEMRNPFLQRSLIQTQEFLRKYGESTLSDVLKRNGVLLG